MDTNEVLVSEVLSEDDNATIAIDNSPTYDRGRPNYPWWSRFRVGRSPGYELASAAFAEPLLNVLSQHIMGDGFTVKTDNEQADKIFADFVRANQAMFNMWLKDALALGDSYAVVNPDGSISMPPANTVKVLHNPFDYTRPTGYELVTQVDRGTITDRYELMKRVLSWQIDENPENLDDETDPPLQEEPHIPILPGDGRDVVFTPVLPGVLPVAHLSWNRGGNEVYGRPCYMPLVTLFKRYHDLLDATIRGVRAMGRPVLWVGGSKNPAGDRKENSRKVKFSDEDGSTQEKYVVDFDATNIIWLGEGASFHIETPGPFAGEAQTILKLMFLIVIEHLRIPEYVWGPSISSSKASAETQQPPFVRSIVAARAAIEPVLLHLLSVWYQIQGIYDGHPAIDIEGMNVQWPEVAPSDEMVLLEKIKLGALDNVITPETELALLDFDNIDDPIAEVKAAQAFADEQQDKDMARQADMSNAIASDSGGDAPFE